MVQADSETSLARMGDGRRDIGHGGRPPHWLWYTVSGGAKRFLMSNMQPYDVRARRLG